MRPTKRLQRTKRKWLNPRRRSRTKSSKRIRVYRTSKQRGGGDADTDSLNEQATKLDEAVKELIKQKNYDKIKTIATGLKKEVAKELNAVSGALVKVAEAEALAKAADAVAKSAKAADAVAKSAGAEEAEATAAKAEVKEKLGILKTALDKAAAEAVAELTKADGAEAAEELKKLTKAVEKAALKASVAVEANKLEEKITKLITIKKYVTIEKIANKLATGLNAGAAEGGATAADDVPVVPFSPLEDIFFLLLFFIFCVDVAGTIDFHF